MAAISDPDVSESFGRYRFRGLDPKSVERWAINYENENAGLRAQITALDARATKADAFAEEALIEATTLRETIARMEAEREDVAARQRMIRDEAAQIIHDAWAEANIVRAQTQLLTDRAEAQREAAKVEHAREIERLHAQAAAEIASTVEQVRRTLAVGLETQQARVAALERQRARLIAEIEASTAHVLNGLAPLKASALRTSQGWSGAPESDAPRAVREATDGLALLVTAMQQSLRPPSDEQETTHDGGDRLASEGAEIAR